MAENTPAPTSHPYTCNTCAVAFRTSAHQRTHMQSDWHRYNLKRRVASLPPLTSEVFNEKVLANQATAAATAARASFERVCAVCERTYYSENAYVNHLSSKKHKEKMLVDDGTETESMTSSTFSLGESTERGSEAGKDGVAEAAEGLRKAKLAERKALASNESTDEDDEEDASTTAGDDTAQIPLKCLFCNALGQTMQANVAHMYMAHGMYVPEQKYLVDLPGLIEYLHEQVHDLHECLYCGTTKYTSPGIQTHMRDKGHCMIAFESEAQMIEIGQFYDFSSTYSDDEEEEEEHEDTTKSGGVKLGGTRTATYQTEDGEEEEDEEWESDEDEDEDVSSGDEKKEKSAGKARRPKARQQAYVDDYELHLPSGRSVGHRQFARYFRQNLHNYPTPEERAARLAITDDTRHDSDEEMADANGARRNSNGEIVRGRGREPNAISRANGGLGMLGVSDQKKREVQAAEKKSQKQAQRKENQYRARVDRRANNQKHFRDPLLQ